ncbi:nucleotidyltransferase family protein [Desulfosporosinus metallidurans]|uniref:Polymerase beta nucleotidyltransferase domain-containing protein n=1 Tax=Desulfosporosinus metallidurans TaxID=1888891 RepID=A0A1Q8R0S9_9FIRM|nr:nucleotidyltransferase domain-containing protein [Desulfosporosinus metallidurans]OLN33204.1 hypothetical protein DSOL_0931 [Desulfosporosinus metallidurans]
MISVSEGQLKIILDIIREFVPHCEVRAFGSRYKWTAKVYSDLDLSIEGEDKLDWTLMENIQEAFQESDLPFRVDILDWNAISPEFKKVIEQGYEVIYTA